MLDLMQAIQRALAEKGVRSNVYASDMYNIVVFYEMEIVADVYSFNTTYDELHQWLEEIRRA